MVCTAIYGSIFMPFVDPENRILPQGTAVRAEQPSQPGPASSLSLVVLHDCFYYLFAFRKMNGLFAFRQINGLFAFRQINRL